MTEGSVVHIVDDDQDLCEAIAKIVRLVKLEVVTYGSATEFLERFKPGTPGCLVLDIRMPGMSGTELQDRLVALGERLPVIMISGCADVSTAVRAMKAGALEVFEKGNSMHRLVEMIQKAVADDCSRRLDESKHDEIRVRYNALSPREREVLMNILEGKTNKVVAQTMGISSNTVEIHRARVMEKMGAPSLVSLIKSCVYAGLDKAGKSQQG